MQPCGTLGTEPKWARHLAPAHEGSHSNASLVKTAVVGISSIPFNPRKVSSGHY